MAMTPVVITPVTDLRRLMHYEFQLHPNTACAKIERRYNVCVDAYGTTLSVAKCKDLKFDFLECVSHVKQNQRRAVLKEEIKRQYKSGERAVKYENPPPRDSFMWC